MQKSNEKKALVLSAIAVITLIAVVVGATYAYFQAQGGGSSDIDVNANTATTDNLSFQIGGAISLTANQEDFGSGMPNKSGSTTASATLTANNATNNATRNYYVYLDITSNDFEYTTDDEQAELLLKITDPDGTEVITLGSLERKTSGGVTGFDITTSTGLITIADNYEITSTGTVTQEWQIEVIFANLDSDQNANAGKSFSASLIIQEDKIPTTVADICESGDNLASCIAELNTLAGDGADSIYYHDADLANGAQDNSYRYSGANPNNYVCFGPGAESEGTCANDNLYRIIGAFDDDKDSNYQIKLIKSDYVTSDMLGTDGRDYVGAYNWDDGSYYKGNMETSTIATYRWNYDTSVSRYGSNNWTTSEFNTINLNTNYWNYLGTTWQNLIAETTWYLGGMTSELNTAKAFYDGERNNAGYGSNPTTYNDEIGLMYPSDYGYAASPDTWTNNLFNYNNSTITSNNWMYMGLYEWTITPGSSYSRSVFSVYRSGNLSTGNAYNRYAARPVFYLESNVQLEGGSGTITNPIRISR